ncbi:hypothetical protein MMSR116_12280 [Methylobacterium mesophilicum SR1.6/6]|uniref:Uncharacterized protein n=1 Tax=Methylobacterium mesophilicum SR1.6/6 TaxID=908290 RepID=A0A6B9FJ41_9HYPH|nr:hypothetical protein [Methylobacterium mesophilicum]QGY02563.1 hypothetical protein MMSR116_12280 [Methylobacterium mesophilicum SR1.6/6]
MIDLALDASETRATRRPDGRLGRSAKLRIVLFGLAGAGALGGFGVAASSLMAGLAAPAPVKFVASGRATDWPDLKDGLPALAGSGKPPSTQVEKPAEPAGSDMRMAGLPDTYAPSAAGTSVASADAAPIPARAPAQAAAAPVPPARRIPVPTPVAPLAAGRQVVPLPPARMAALQSPRASETVRARDVHEPAAAPKPVAPPATPAAISEKTEKPARKVAASHKPPAVAKPAEKAKAAPTAVAQAEPAEETEVLGIKLPSLAPAGRKLKESVDALGEAVKNVF